MAIDLYHIPPSPPCRAVRMTAALLGIKLNEKLIDLLANEHLKPEFLKLNPQHTVPTIDDNGFILWESRAIMTYLANKYAPDSPLYPKDPQERAIVDRMLYFDHGTLYKTQYEYQAPQQYRAQPPDPEKEELYKKALVFLETFLEKTPYVAGNHLTLADVAVLATLTFASIIDYSFVPYPKISSWLEKVKSEIPNHKEINEDSMERFTEFLKSKNFSIF